MRCLYTLSQHLALLSFCWGIFWSKTFLFIFSLQLLPKKSACSWKFPPTKLVQISQSEGPKELPSSTGVSIGALWRKNTNQWIKYSNNLYPVHKTALVAPGQLHAEQISQEREHFFIVALNQVFPTLITYSKAKVATQNCSWWVIDVFFFTIKCNINVSSLPLSIISIYMHLN